MNRDDLVQLADAELAAKYVVVLASGRSASPWGRESDLPTAIKDLRKLKTQGRTAWIEDTTGRFVPVEGTRRKPKGYDRP